VNTDLVLPSVSGEALDQRVLAKIAPHGNASARASRRAATPIMMRVLVSSRSLGRSNHALRVPPERHAPGPSSFCLDQPLCERALQERGCHPPAGHQKHTRSFPDPAGGRICRASLGSAHAGVRPECSSRTWLVCKAAGRLVERRKVSSSPESRSDGHSGSTGAGRLTMMVPPARTPSAGRAAVRRPAHLLRRNRADLSRDRRRMRC